MENPSACSMPLLELLTALIPIALAIFGGYIAWQQFQTNKKKLKLDLFEKRYAVFECVNAFLLTVAKGQKVNQQQRDEFLSGTRSAEFLFGPDIKKYIDEIWVKAVDADCWVECETPYSARERTDAMKWLHNQLKDVDKKFIEYMNISH